MNSTMPKPKHGGNTKPANATVANASKPKEKAKPVKPLTKKDLQKRLSDETGLTVKQVALVLDSLGTTIVAEVQDKGVFALPGLLKVTKVTKKATPEKQGVSPLTKQPMTIKAKPERKVIKVRPLKTLKEAV